MIKDFLSITAFLRDPEMVCKAVAEGQSFTVIRRSKPVFRIVAVEDETKIKPREKITLKKLKTFSAKTGEKFLSSQIDKILYGK